MKNLPAVFLASLAAAALAGPSARAAAALDPEIAAQVAALEEHAAQIDADLAAPMRSNLVEGAAPFSTRLDGVVASLTSIQARVASEKAYFTTTYPAPEIAGPLGSFELALGGDEAAGTQGEVARLSGIASRLKTGVTTLQSAEPKVGELRRAYKAVNDAFTAARSFAGWTAEVTTAGDGIGADLQGRCAQAPGSRHCDASQRFARFNTLLQGLSQKASALRDPAHEQRAIELAADYQPKFLRHAQALAPLAVMPSRDEKKARKAEIRALTKEERKAAELQDKMDQAPEKAAHSAKRKLESGARDMTAIETDPYLKFASGAQNAGLAVINLMRVDDKLEALASRASRRAARRSRSTASASGSGS